MANKKVVLSALEGLLVGYGTDEIDWDFDYKKAVDIIKEELNKYYTIVGETHGEG